MQFLHRLGQWLTGPSPKITEPDQRRQASLLSSFLLGAIVLAILVESVTVALIEWEEYTGYRQTILAVCGMVIIYGISRTRYFRLAAVLAVFTTSGAIFLSGWAVPAGVLGGLLDFLILPLWLASLYLNVRTLLLFTLLNMAALLVFPLLVPAVTLNDILVGPFSFLVATSILLMVITRHRNQLEQDRRAELTENERYSRRGAARAGALLRVAERLNVQLDLDALLTAISEEVALALNTPVSLVALFDPKQNALYTTAGVGIPADIIRSMSPIPVNLYGQKLRELGTLTGLPDPQKFAGLPNQELFRRLDLSSMAFAMMEYEGETIGGVTAISQSENRYFSEDELLLLQGLARQAALAIVNTRLFKDARRRLEHLQALRAIDLAIASNYDLRETLDVLLKQITTELAVDATVILLMDETQQLLEYGASLGFHTPTLRFTRLRVGEGIAGRAAQQNEIVHIPDLQTDPQTLVYAPSLAREGFVSYFAAPLFALGKVRGVLEIFHRSTLDPDAEWLGFLEALAGQAATAIENTTLVQDLQRTNEELSKILLANLRISCVAHHLWHNEVLT